MNFNQWRNYAAKGDVSKITYVCGEQSTLVELVVDDIKDILNTPDTDYTYIDASQSVDVWELLSRYPLNPDHSRLTVIRNADELKSWNQLPQWLALSRTNPKNFAVFVSNQSDAPAIFAKGKKVSYADHIEQIRTKGKFIKCSQPNDEDLVKWCMQYGVTEDGAQFLVQRTSADVSEMFSVLKKVKVWDGAPNKKALELFCNEQALDSVADYIILQDKKSAFLALQNLSTVQYSQIISRLNMRLDMMTDIYRCTTRRMYDADIAQTTGIKIFLVKKFKAVAKDYEYSKVKMRRQIIGIADAAINSGAKTGVLESVISLW